VHDRTLAIALWISTIIHGAAFLIPGPGAAEPPAGVALEIEWLPSEAVTSAATAPDPAPDPDTDTVKDTATVTDTVTDTDTATVTETETVTETATETETETETETATETETETKTATATETETETETETDTDTDTDTETSPYPDPDPAPSPSPSPTLDERIESLLRATAEKLEREGLAERYRFIEVRERVLGALEGVHPGARTVSGDAARFRALLRFRVDGDGYITDLELRLPPGSRLDARAIERAVASLNPLPAPPPGTELPLRFEWRVDFLE